MWLCKTFSNSFIGIKYYYYCCCCCCCYYYYHYYYYYYCWKFVPVTVEQPCGSSTSNVYWRSFINALLLKFWYSRYCITFTSCLLEKTFKLVQVILWKSDDPVSITVEFWNILTYLQWLVQYKKILFRTVDLYRPDKYLARQFRNGYSMLNSTDIERLRKLGQCQKYNLSCTRIFKNG